MKTFRLILALFVDIAPLYCLFRHSHRQKKLRNLIQVILIKLKLTTFTSLPDVLPAELLRLKAKENLETLYPNQFKQGLITFQSVNLEEALNKPLAEKLGVSGQTLLIVKGDQKINLTNEGFMYAVVKPEKFKEIINEKVDGLLIK